MIQERNVETFCVTIYIAGDIQEARRSLRRQCWDEGLCVTVTPTTFIFTGGAEEGFAVGLVNYPRFPKTMGEIYERALKVAMTLMEDLCQWSVLMVTPNQTKWITRKEEV